jgi:inner membrane protein
MDSVTQIALGAAIGEATLGRKVGSRALLWGGVCGLFPDLDVLVPLQDAVKAFTYHRGPSHSLFVLAALTPLFVWLIQKLHPQTAVYRIRWYALVYLAFSTHVLLDCLTVYGTQIFWPLPTPPVMWSTIFIIDPVYSVPLFFGVLAALILSRNSSRGHVINTVCLALSTSYLMWSVGAKLYVTNTVRESLQRQNIRYHQLLTVPAPLNTLLWRVLAMEDHGYYEGFYSLFDETDDIQVKHYPSREDLLQGITDHWPVKRLQWFTHGFYSVERLADDIVITDLRMGLEPSYVFRFKVAEVDNPHNRPTKSRQMFDARSWKQLRWVWQRIWNATPEVVLIKSEDSAQLGSPKSTALKKVGFFAASRALQTMG